MTTEEKILKVSLELFSKFGYVGTSTKKIAEKAGVNEVTLFRKFKTKSNLFQEVISECSKEGNIIKNLSNELTGDFDKDINIFGISFYNFLKNNQLMYKLQVKQVDEKTMKFTNSLKYKKYFSRYLERSKNENIFTGNSEEVASNFLSMVMGLFTFEIFTNDFVKELDIPDLIKKESERIIREYKKK